MMFFEISFFLVIHFVVHHKNFTDEMAKKSVINRCCKNFVNSAKDNDVLIDTLNRTIENDYEEPTNGGFTINQDKVIDI